MGHSLLKLVIITDIKSHNLHILIENYEKTHELVIVQLQSSALKFTFCQILAVVYVRAASISGLIKAP